MWVIARAQPTGGAEERSHGVFDSRNGESEPQTKVEPFPRDCSIGEAHVRELNECATKKSQLYAGGLVYNERIPDRQKLVMAQSD
jgi:hypothetical protein